MSRELSSAIGSGRGGAGSNENGRHEKDNECSGEVRPTGRDSVKREARNTIEAER